MKVVYKRKIPGVIRVDFLPKSANDTTFQQNPNVHYLSPSASILQNLQAEERV